MTDFLTPSIELAPTQSPARRPIAATVDAGLAGLLSNVLANQRRAETPSPADDELIALFEVSSSDHAPIHTLNHDSAGELLVDDLDEGSLFDETEESLHSGEEAPLVDDEESLFAVDEEDSLFDEEDSLFDEEDTLFAEAEDNVVDIDEETLFTEELPTQDLFPTLAQDESTPDFQPSASGEVPVQAQPALAAPAAVTHVVVHHVHDSALPVPKIGRFGPAVTPAGLQTTAHTVVVDEEPQSPIPKLRDAFDSFDTETSPAFAHAVEDSSAISYPAAFTPQVAAELVESNKINFENNPVFLPGVTPTPSAVAAEKIAPPPAPRVARILSPLQINLLIEGLAQVRARPGEEGLPPGMLLMDVRGPLGRFQTDSLYTIRSQIDGAVRGGDMALVVPDIGIVLFCGGLFFPGDLEVMGSRLRRRALDANPSAIPSDAIRVTVAGALAFPGDDAIEFVKRGVETFDVAVETAREDIVIDYVDPRRPRI